VCSAAIGGQLRLQALILPTSTLQTRMALTGMAPSTSLLLRNLAKNSLALRKLSLGGCLANRELVAMKEKERGMSSAMKMYLQRKREHDMFISKERAEFEVGKQHLAAMMGLDAASLEQEDIDRSIEYLFPSGLAPEARPSMRPPEEVFPRQKEAEFDVEGRPFHPFFYTLKPHFQESVYRMREHLEAVTIFGDRLRRQGKGPDPEQVLNAGKMAGSRWATREEMAKRCLEKVTEQEHADFVALLDRLVSLPFSYRVKDELFAWRVKEGTAAEELFVQPQFDETGRAFVEAEGRRKTAHAKVKVTKPGTGKLAIKHKDYPHIVSDITYFFGLKERHVLLYPLQVTKMLGLVDIEAEVSSSGPSAQAGAIRYALSMGLRSFVDKETIDDMKLLGLLTADIRVRERKWYGRVSARKGYTWKRR